MELVIVLVIVAVVIAVCLGIAWLIAWVYWQYLALVLAGLQAFGPEAVLVLSLLGTTVGPVLFARVLLQRFGHPGWRMVAFVPIIAVLALVHVDLSFLAATGLHALVPTALGSLLLPWLEHAATHGIVNGWLVSQLAPGVADVLADYDATTVPPAIVVVVVVSAVAKTVVLPPLLLLARGGTTEPTGDLRPPYVFSEAWEDLGAVLTEPFRLLWRGLKWVGSALKTALSGWRPLGTWPFVLLVVLGLVVPAAAVVLETAVLAAGFAVAVAAGATVLVWTATVLHVAERAVLLVRGSYAVCPHTGCHARVPQPVVACPECGRRHPDLVPGRRGVLLRTCACGHRLPTLHILGKGRLPASCPSCQRPLPSGLFGGISRLVLLGSPSSGKTMVLTALTWELLERRSDVTATLVADEDRTQWDEVWRPDYVAGRVREKTRAEDPTAFTLSLRRGVGVPHGVYLYDPAGEATQQQAGLEPLRFLREVDGVLLVVDPLSLPPIRAALPEAALRSAATEAPGPVLDRLVNRLEASGRLPLRRRGRVPVAVLVTKVDEGALPERGRLHPAPAAARWSAAGAATSAGVRAWLERHDGNLVRTLEDRFSRVRYFAVSAQGDDSSFRPDGLRAVLQWLLASTLWLRWPTPARAVVVAVEVAVVLAVVGLLLGGPVAAVVWGMQAQPAQAHELTTP